MTAMPPVSNRELARRHSKAPYIWFALALCVLGLAFGLYYAFTGTVKQASHIGVATRWIPTQRTWHPNVGYYCAANLSTTDANYLATVVNAAPTAASHKAMLAFWHTQTPANLATVQSSYVCKGK